jgi:hypothetical protein
MQIFKSSFGNLFNVSSKKLKPSVSVGEKRKDTRKVET